VTYVFVRADDRQRQQGQPKLQGRMDYGTANANSGSAGAGGNNTAAGSSSAPSQAARAPASSGNGEGPSEGGAPPPSYAQVVAGDHKVQSQD